MFDFLGDLEFDIWGGLGDAIYKGLIKPILDFLGTVWDAIVGFFREVGRAIYNAVVSFVDTVISFIEYTLNSVRQYLPYAIAVTISWTMITRAWKSEKLSLLKKVGYTIAAPIVGYFVASVFDAIVPPGVQFPRLSTVVQPAKISGSFNHPQYVDVSVVLVPKYEVIEGSFSHPQAYYETVVLAAPVMAEGTFNHSQTYYHTVNLA